MSDLLTEEFQLSHPESKSNMSSSSSSSSSQDAQWLGGTKSLSVSAPKIPLFNGESHEWKRWQNDAKTALLLCRVLYTVVDADVNKATGLTGTSSQTIWSKNFKWTAPAVQEVYDLDVEKAYALIYGSLGKSVASKINFQLSYNQGDPHNTVKFGDAKKLWEVLVLIYDKKTTVTVMICWEQLLNERLRHDEKVSDFALRLKDIRDKIKAQQQDVPDTLVVYRFLSGLTKDYNTVVTVLRQTKNLELEEVIRAVTDHEETLTYIRLKESNESKESSANYVNGRHGGKFKGKNDRFKPNKFKPSKGRNPFQGESKQEERPQGGQGFQSNQGNKSQLKCQLCNKTGHEAAKCWSYSVQQKPAPVKSSVPRFGKHGRANITEGSDEEDDYSHAYCTQVIDDDQEQSYAARQVDSSTDGGTIVMKLDSGSTHHHVSESSKELLDQVEELARPTTVLTASNERLVSKFKGDVDGIDQQGNKLVIKGVKCTPGFRVNLMSVSLWCKQCPPTVKRSMVFDKDGVVALEDDKVVFKGVERDGLYELRIDTNHRLSKSYVAETVEEKKTQDYKELHAKLGHMNMKTITDMVKFNAVDGIDEYKIPSLHQLQGDNESCEQCVLGKSHRNPFGNRMNRRKVDRIMGRLFADLSGPINANESKRIHQQLGNKRYASVILDEVSGFIHVKTLEKKSEAAQHLKEFSLLGENSTGNRVHYIHTDQGSEYVNQDLQQFATGKGIQLETTVAYTPQQNGKVERVNRTIFNLVRTILVECKLNHAF